MSEEIAQARARFLGNLKNEFFPTKASNLSLLYLKMKE